MNIEVENVKGDYTYKVGASEVMVECEIDLENKGGLGRILSVTGDAVYSKVDAFVGEAKVYGKVRYHIIYLDASGMVKGIEYCSDFSESIGSSDITGDSQLDVMLSVEDIDSMAKGDSIRLQTVVDIVLLGIRHQTCKAVSEVDDAFIKYQDAKTSMHISNIEEKVDIMDTYEVGADVDEILFFECASVVRETRPSHDSVKVVGEATARIIYTSDGKVITHNMTVPFDEDIRCLGVDSTSKVCLRSEVEDSKIVLEGVVSNNSIKVVMTLLMRGSAYEYGTVKVAEDIFSDSVDIDVNRDDCKYQEVVQCMSQTERIEGESTLGDDVAPIRKIIATVIKPNIITNTKVEEGEVTVDSLIDCDVIYMNEDDKCDVLTLEIPSSVVINSENIKDSDIVYVSPCVLGVTSKVKHEKSIAVIVDLALSIGVLRAVSDNLIVGIEEKGEKVSCHKLMSVYFTKKGDSLWDVMRNIGESEDVIRSNNSDIDFESIAGGEHVVVWRNKVK